MDCFIGNVPAQSHPAQFEKYLRGILEKLKIKTFECRKDRNKNFAIVTFLHVNDGLLFLRYYGVESRQKPQQNTHSDFQLNYLLNVSNASHVRKERLFFLKAALVCEPGNKLPNEFTLKSLQMQENKINELAKMPNTANDQNAHEHRKLRCSSVLCGMWSYSGTAPVFECHATFNNDWTVHFGKRNLSISVGKQERRIIIHYPTIEGITFESQPSPSMTLSLFQAPTMSEGVSDADMEMVQMAMESLSLGPRNRPKNNARRVWFLSPEHEAIASKCLVYRLSMPKGLSRQQMSQIHRNRDVPTPIFQATQVTKPGEPYATALRKLHTALSQPPYQTLPFAVRFQVQKIAQNGYLPPTFVCALLLQISTMVRRSGGDVVALAIRNLFNCNQIAYPGPETESSDLTQDTIISYLEENEERAKTEILFNKTSNKKQTGLAVVYRATVTPTTCFLSGPEPEAENRILRKYSENLDQFLRVTFADEDWSPVRYNPRVSNEEVFKVRFAQVLQDGINIAGRKYSFLGFSHSSLRAQSCWFMAPFYCKKEGRVLLDRMVIGDIGDFSHIRSPAKCAARIGQAFSDTREKVTLDSSIVTKMGDVERNGRTFSDGVGTFSVQFLQYMRDSLPNGYGNSPTCFQIRYRGAKGMLSLDSRIPGNAVRIRESMIKFEGSGDDLEICGSSKRPLRMYLNRQLIKILEDCGVDGEWFLALQRKAVQELRSITESSMNASFFLEARHIGGAFYLPWFIRKINALGMPFQEDDFLKNVIEMMVLVELRSLKYRSRIPVAQGHTLYGIMDETDTLKEGQVFIITSTESGDGKKDVLTGKNMIVTRSPALHPGDVQIVEAIDVPRDHPLRKLSNCICFSQKGERDLPSKLSGGDLDGDLYHIIFDPAARPKQIFYPADYPRAEPIDIGRPIEKEDMINFFITFMQTDQLGRIATLHQVIADQQEAGTLALECIKLASMHSTAVDYSKTGIPVNLKDLPRFDRHRPDFMAPGPHVLIHSADSISLKTGADPSQEEEDDEDFTEYKYYESPKILGGLYRDIDELAIFTRLSQQLNSGTPTKRDLIHKLWDYCRKSCWSVQWSKHVDWAQNVRGQYEESVLNIMAEYAPNPRYPLTELEAFIGQIVGKTSAQDRRYRDLSTSLKEKFDTDVAWIVDQMIRDDGQAAEDSLERAVACLFVAQEPGMKTRKGDSLKSFKYVAAAVCLKEVTRALSV